MLQICIARVFVVCRKTCVRRPCVWCVFFTDLECVCALCLYIKDLAVQICIVCVCAVRRIRVCAVLTSLFGGVLYVQPAKLKRTEPSTIAAASSKRAKHSAPSTPPKKTPPSKTSPSKTSPSKKSKKKVEDSEGESHESDGELEEALTEAKRCAKIRTCRNKLKQLIKMKNFPKELQPRADEFPRAELNEAFEQAETLFPVEAREIAMECLGVKGSDEYCGRLTVDYFSTMKKWYVGVIIAKGPDPNDDNHPVYSVLFQDTEMINYTDNDDFRELLDED